MPLNKEAYLRYKIIDACLSNRQHPYPSMEDLIDACQQKLGHEFDLSTIQKDIQAMKLDELLGFNAPIKYSKSQNGYYYSEPNFTINKIPLTPTDIEALKSTIDLIAEYKGTRLNENINHALEKILTEFKQHFPEGNPKKKIIQTDAPPSHKGFEHFEFFYSAAAHKIPVCFVHYSYSKRKFNSVIVHPAILKEFQNHWYVVGYSENHKQLRTFGLDRVYEPVLLKRNFIEAPTKEQLEYFSHVYGVYPIAKQKRQKIVFRIDPKLSDSFLAHPIHETQHIDKRKENGSLTISLDLLPSMELINFFLSYGNLIHVQKPQWIAQEIINIQLSALKNEKQQ
jgi:predicted DNA-binding transcriptional regulator YafY